MDFFLFVLILIFILIENSLLLEDLLIYFYRTFISYFNQINTWRDEINSFFSKNPKLVLAIIILKNLTLLIPLVIIFFLNKL